MNWIKLMLTAALTAAAGNASIITYTETITASGSLDGVAFTNQLVTIALTGNTNSIVNKGSGVYGLAGTALVTVANVGGDLFTDTMAVAVDQTLPGAGIQDVTLSTAVLANRNAGFASYALNGAIGPLSGASAGSAASSFATSRGTLSLTGPFGIDHPSTFTATVAPEPGTFVFLSAGIGLIALRKRRAR